MTSVNVDERLIADLGIIHSQIVIAVAHVVLHRLIVLLCLLWNRSNVSLDAF